MFFKKSLYICTQKIYPKDMKKFRIIYKEREIDYEKTLAALEEEGYVLIPTSDRDITNIRNSVSKAAKKFIDGRTFTVNKTINGASITRIPERK